MAGAISAYANPGLLQVVDKAARFKLQFTKPRDVVNVEIRFFEVDSWVSNGRTITESDKPPTLIGTIGGSLQRGAFKQTSQAIPFPKDPIKALLTVDIDGELITMPMPNVDNEKELDFFEVSFTITGVVNGTADIYQSPTPVFLRRTATPRAEVAFIAGDRNDFPDDPTTTEYFTLAAEFWSNLRDNKSNERSLAGIINFLREEDDKMVKARNSLPWGRINIVSHGNDSTWFIRSHVGDAEHSAFTAATLKQEDLGVLGPPRRKEVDDRTEIIIRGCEIGNDVALLNAIRDKFGGQAVVFAPKFENIYRRENGVVRDRLFQDWVISLAGARDFPDQQQMVSLLKQKYAGHPLYGGFSDAEWNTVAGITGTFSGNATAFRQRVRVRKPSDPADTVSAECDQDEVMNGATPKTQQQLTAMMRERMKEDIPNAVFDRFGWTWTVTSKKGAKPPLFLVSGFGVRTSLEIYRLLTKQEDGKTVPVTPDHLNPSQFGRSS